MSQWTGQEREALAEERLGYKGPRARCMEGQGSKHRVLLPRKAASYRTIRCSRGAGLCPEALSQPSLLSVVSCGIHRMPSAPSLRVTYKSRRTYLPALSCLVGPPCTSASWTGCRGRSGPWPQARWRSRPPLLRTQVRGGEWAAPQPHNPSSSRCGWTSRTGLSTNVSQ